MKTFLIIGLIMITVKYLLLIEDRESRINDEFDQIIISSDRIIFDSTREDITISSIRNINFGL